MMVMRICFFCFCVIVPYSGEALRKMIDKQHEEIKQKLHKFAEIMKQEHVRVTYFILSTLNQVHWLKINGFLCLHDHNLYIQSHVFYNKQHAKQIQILIVTCRKRKLSIISLHARKMSICTEIIFRRHLS